MKKKILLLLVFVLMFIPNVWAEEEEELIEEVAQECEVSEAYIRWSNLSEEEQNKVMTPEYCKSNGLGDVITSKKSLDKGSYAARYESYYAPVKNQSVTGACWAFAATGVVESYFNKTYGDTKVLSPGHMNYMESQSFTNRKNPYGFIRTVNSGGNYDMSSQYLMNRYGSVYESDFYTRTDVENLPKINTSSVYGKKNRVNVNNIDYIYRSSITNIYGNHNGCTYSEKNLIKEYVTKYGAVGVSMWMDSYYYYNSYTYAYLFKDYGYDSAWTNHSVMIVGWDDNYAVSNFNGLPYKPVQKGAWIVQNSYGTGFGDNGRFYVSYEDDEICTNIFAITDADYNTDANSYTYAHGYIHNIAESSATMNVFTKKNNKYDEVLEKVTFNILKPGNYKVYYAVGNAKKKKLNQMKLIASGSTEYTGWITIKPKSRIVIPKNKTKYSIAVYQDSKVHGLNGKKTTGYKNSGASYNTKSTDTYTSGMSYVFLKGKWRDLYSWYSNGPFKNAISAFTDNIMIKVEEVRPQYSFNDYIDLNIEVKALSSGKITKVELVKGGKVYASQDYTNMSITKGTYYLWPFRKNDLSDITSGKYQLRVYTNNGVYAYKNFNIKLIPIMGIIITNNKGAKLEVGQTLKLNAVVSPATHNYIRPELSYTSSDENIASVNNNGEVIGINPGTATITVESLNGVTATYDIEVIKSIKSISINGDYVKMNPGATVSLDYRVMPSDTSMDKTVNWEVDTDGIVSIVNDPVNYKLSITAYRPGITSVTGTSSNGITKTITVMVKGSSITPEEYTLELKNSLDMNVNIIDDTNEIGHTATWSSSKSSVATVNSNGKVVAKKVGTTVITAIDNLGNVLTSQITVTKRQAKNFTVSNISAKTYTGKSIKPSIKVSYKNTTLKERTHYTIKYGTNKNPGKGVITITAKKSALYEGSKKVYFIIKPNKAEISKVTSGSGYIKVSYKLMNKVNNYQIQYKVKEDSVWQTVESTTSVKTIKELFSGFNYQVRVRGYITVGDKNYYGPYSAIKTIKCK